MNKKLQVGFVGLGKLGKIAADYTQIPSLFWL